MAMTVHNWNFKGWIFWRFALVTFAVGSLFAARLAHLSHVRADGDRVFELRVYHAVPGKLPALEAQFREKISVLLAKHDLKVVGFWVSTDAADNAFVFMVAHASREEAKKNWAALFADPAFQEILKSEQADKLVEKIDSMYLRPTDFSPMR
jgi:NIPSNAP